MRGKAPWLIGCGGIFVVVALLVGFTVMKAAGPLMSFGKSMARAGQVASVRCPVAIRLQQTARTERKNAGQVADPAQSARIYAAYLPCIRDARGLDRADLEVLAATALAPASTAPGAASSKLAEENAALLADARRNAGDDAGLLSLISLLEKAAALQSAK